MTGSELDRAVTLIDSGDKEEGIALLCEIHQKDPKNEKVCLLLAKYINFKETKLRYLEEALEINPVNNETINSIKEVLSRADNTKYYKNNVMDKNEISSDQFYERFESAIFKKKDVELLRIYNRSGRKHGRGYIIIEETRYNLSKGNLHISKMQVMT